jgi:Ser/Thr protein kinase RdoA (MazF antagonist)
MDKATLDHSALHEVVQRLLGSSQAPFYSVERLFGGGNNRAYRVDTRNRRYFLKLYHQDPEDPRRRGQTEFRWLDALWKSGVHEVPEPLAFYENSQFSLDSLVSPLSAGLYEYISGDAPLASDLDAFHVEKASEFLVRINSARSGALAQSLPSASEACFSIQQHWNTIEKRIQGLEAISSVEGSIYAEAKRFIDQTLRPSWTQLSHSRVIGQDSHLPRADQILSPSDFGFHNALIGKDNSIRFIDFEYAGWDDPAKLICDFFNQVAVPVPRKFYSIFCNGLKSLVTDPKALSARVSLLYPAYQIKWACILLNHFLPSGQRRKKFALQKPEEWENLLKVQLQKATSLIAALEWSGLNE